MRYYLATRYPLDDIKEIFETHGEACDVLLHIMKKSGRQLKEKIDDLKEKLGDKYYFWAAKECLKIDPSEHNAEEQAEIRLYKKIVELKNDLYMIAKCDSADVFCTLLAIDETKCPNYRKVYLQK